MRREEVAALAGVSVDYYVRLEQARVRPSDSVLNAVARALHLRPPERAHLYRLVHGDLPELDQVTPEQIRPEVQRLLDAFAHLPAIVVNQRLDVLAWNRLAAALITDFGSLPPEHRNTAWLLFIDPATRRLYRQWPRIARETAGILRRASTAAHDAATQRLIDNLSRISSEFRSCWAEHDVQVKTSGVKQFQHPTVGDLTLQYEAMSLSDPNQSLILYAPADTATHDSLKLLSAWSTTTPSVPPAPRVTDTVPHRHPH